jgi:hypothetical protein
MIRNSKNRVFKIVKKLFLNQTFVFKLFKIAQYFCRYQGKSSAYECATWLSTGGVLSPLDWNMMADSLLNRLKNFNCFVQGFADDIVRKLFDTELILNNQVKYLEVILESKLN